MPQNLHIEGGDVLYHSNTIFIGYYDKDDYSDLFTARTNKGALDYFIEFFPEKIVKGFHLNKSFLLPKEISIIYLAILFPSNNLKYLFLPFFAILFRNLSFLE